MVLWGEVLELGVGALRESDLQIDFLWEVTLEEVWVVGGSGS